MAGRDNTSDRGLETRLQARDDHRTRAAASVRTAYADVDAVLDVRQRIRFRTFEMRMERRQNELPMRARVTPAADRPSQVDRAPIRPGDHLYTVGVTVWRARLANTASGKRWIRRLVVVCLGVASAAAPAWAQAPDTLTEELGARLEKKIDAILRYAVTEADETRLTTLLEPEINAYFRFQGAVQMPDGLTDPAIRILDDLQVTVDAVIDLDAIREQRSRTWLDPLSYLGGRLPVFASGTVSVTNGAAQVKIEQITVNRVPMPVQVLQELVGYFTRTPNNPQGTQLDQPIPLPYGITELRQTRGRAVIVQ